MHKFLTVVLALLLTACAGYSGKGLIVGQSETSDIINSMGEPEMQWRDHDGSRLFSYPRGPMGVHTYMVQISKDGKLQRIENVMSPESFNRIETGMSKEQVLRILGPSQPSWTTYFKARDELVWEWLYCDEWNRLAHFDVLFDGTNETVRSTMSHRKDCGLMGDCWCSH